MAKAKRKQSTRRAINRRRKPARRASTRQETPHDRLTTDGAASPHNIQPPPAVDRERMGLDAPPKVGRAVSEDLARCCNRHRISYDWMLGGCLNGLKKMVDERRRRERAALSTAAMVAMYALLTPEHQAIFTAKLNRILAERNQ